MYLSKNVAGLAAGAVMAVLAASDASAQQGAVANNSTQPSGNPPVSENVSVISRAADGTPTIRAFRVSAPVNVDGNLDESIYETIEPVTDFIQQDPSPGSIATEKTEVWILFDDKTLYVSARCWDSQPEKQVANELRRDGLNFINNDSFGVGFDTFHDRRNGFQFSVNPLGGLNDSAGTNERDNNRDWNAIWVGRAGKFDGGWTVEMAIPFKSLRYAAGGDQTWGVNARRIVKAKNETSFFTAIPPTLGNAGMLKFSSAATLVGLNLPPSSRLVEFKPYAISGVRTDRSANPVISNDPSGDIGGDAKLGVTKGITADFTYNTDFAQVEDDEQQVNLTRFSLFFPEKREFFLEGQGIFAFGGYGQRRGTTPGDVPLVFFSRRIGLSNDGKVIPIKGGARMTGKAGKYSIGVVTIQTDDDAITASPSTNFSVLRVKRDVLRRSSVGAFYTRRSVSSVGPGSNEVFAADGVFSFFQNLNFNSYVARTKTTGRDGDDLSYRGQLDYNADRYGVQLERMEVGKNFNPEVGYSRRQDFLRHYAFFRFSPRPKRFPAVRKFAWEGSFDRYTNGAGRLETRQALGTFRTEFQNSDIFFVQYLQDYEYLPQPFRIFGSVTIPVAAYEFGNTHVEYDLGFQRKISGGLAFDTGRFYGGTKQTVAYTTPRIELSPRFSVEPAISLNWVDIPEGKFVAKVATTRLVYAFNARMFTSALLQYNSTTNTFSTNARLRWEYQPGSELFVVYTDGRDTLGSGFPQIQSRSLVVKATRFFRL